MDFNEFKESLHQDQPVDHLSQCLQALWWDAKGDWSKAHSVAQDVHNSNGAWVHAYLHRKEGDEWNAGYWYSRAGQSKCQSSLDQEWENIVQALL